MHLPPTGSAGFAGPEFFERSRVLRWGAALVVVLLVVLVAARSGDGMHWQMCDGPMHDPECRPIGPTDLPVAGALVLVALLLLLDLSRVRIAGLFEVERKVDEARREVQDLTREVKVMQSQVLAVTQSVARASADLRHTTNFFTGDAGRLTEEALLGKVRPSQEGREDVR